MKTNKIGSYLAVTAGAGCAASVASGAIQVIGLSGISTPNGVVYLPLLPGGDVFSDLLFNGDDLQVGYITGINSAMFYSDALGVGNESLYARAYSSTSNAVFPTESDEFAVWNAFGLTANSGFRDGSDNWIAFRDSASRFGWLQLSLGDSSAVNSEADLQLLRFVFDDQATSVANAPTLAEAVAAVPEPSSLALLALGAAGLVTRRNRKKAA